MWTITYSNCQIYLGLFARTGDIKYLQSFLNGLPNPRDVSIFRDVLMGFTALHWAVFHGNADAVILLLKAGANPNATNINGATPIQYAIYQKQPEIFRLLLGNNGMSANDLRLRMDEYMGYIKRSKNDELESILKEYS